MVLHKRMSWCVPVVCSVVFMGCGDPVADESDASESVDAGVTMSDMSDMASAVEDMSVVVDTTPPQITSTTPADGAMVSVSQLMGPLDILTFTSDEQLLPISLQDAITVTLLADADMTERTLETSLRYAGGWEIYSEDSEWGAQGLYIIEISTAATDVAGNNLAQNYTWSFRFGS